MYVLFPPSKIKSITFHNLLIDLSRGSIVYKILKPYVAINLAFFFLSLMLIFSMTGSIFSKTQNLL